MTPVQWGALTLLLDPVLITAILATGGVFGRYGLSERTAKLVPSASVLRGTVAMGWSVTLVLIIWRGAIVRSETWMGWIGFAVLWLAFSIGVYLGHRWARRAK